MHTSSLWNTQLNWCLALSGMETIYLIFFACLISLFLMFILIKWKRIKPTVGPYVNKAPSSVIVTQESMNRLSAFCWLKFNKRADPVWKKKKKSKLLFFRKQQQERYYSVILHWVLITELFNSITISEKQDRRETVFTAFFLLLLLFCPRYNWSRKDKQCNRN